MFLLVRTPLYDTPQGEPRFFDISLLYILLYKAMQRKEKKFNEEK